MLGETFPKLSSAQPLRHQHDGLAVDLGMSFCRVLANRDQAAQRVRDIVCWADSTALVPQQLRQLVDSFADG
jgi:hypothetical protein